MDAFELNKIFQTKIETGQSVKDLGRKKNYSMPAEPDLIPNSNDFTINQSQSTFPWIELILGGVVIIIIVCLIVQIPDGRNFLSHSVKNSERQEENNC